MGGAGAKAGSGRGDEMVSGREKRRRKVVRRKDIAGSCMVFEWWKLEAIVGMSFVGFLIE